MSVSNRSVLARAQEINQKYMNTSNNSSMRSYNNDDVPVDELISDRSGEGGELEAQKNEPDRFEQHDEALVSTRSKTQETRVQLERNNEREANDEGAQDEHPIVTPEMLVDALSGHEDGLLAIAERLMEHYDGGYDVMGEAIIDAFADVQKLFQHVVEAAHMEGAAFESNRAREERERMHGSAIISVEGKQRRHFRGIMMGRTSNTIGSKRREQGHRKRLTSTKEPLLLRNLLRYYKMHL